MSTGAGRGRPDCTSADTGRGRPGYRGPGGGGTGYAAPGAARVVNLLLPGGGLILIGHVWAGATVALLFAAFANVAIGAALIFPDDVQPWQGGLAIGLAGGVYAGAQIRLALTLRQSRRDEAAARRRRVLTEVRELMRDGEHRRALDALAALEPAAPTDLLVAYRKAQVLTEMGDPQAAAAAWERLRELDRHKIYDVRAGG